MATTPAQCANLAVVARHRVARRISRATSRDPLLAAVASTALATPPCHSNRALSLAGGSVRTSERACEAPHTPLCRNRCATNSILFVERDLPLSTRVRSSYALLFSCFHPDLARTPFSPPLSNSYIVHFTLRSSATRPVLARGQRFHILPSGKPAPLQTCAVSAFAAGVLRLLSRGRGAPAVSRYILL